MNPALWAHQYEPGGRWDCCRDFTLSIAAQDLDGCGLPT